MAASYITVASGRKAVGKRYIYIYIYIGRNSLSDFGRKNRRDHARPDLFIDSIRPHILYRRICEEISTFYIRPFGVILISSVVSCHTNNIIYRSCRTLRKSIKGMIVRYWNVRNSFASMHILCSIFCDLLYHSKKSC